jgi:uncharacterized membrane protein YvlD (DUF360 family)
MCQRESHLSIIVLGFIFHYLVRWVVRSIIIRIVTHLMRSLSIIGSSLIFHYLVSWVVRSIILLIKTHLMSYF